MPEDEMPYEDVVKALNHPVRRSFMRLILGRKEALSPLEASKILNQPLSNVSYHVRVLVDCAALTLVNTEPVRGSVKHFYRPAPAVDSAWVRAFLMKEAIGGEQAGSGPEDED